MRREQRGKNEYATFRERCIAGLEPKRQCRRCREWRHAYRFSDFGGGLRNLLCATCRIAVDGAYAERNRAAEQKIRSNARQYSMAIRLAFFLGSLPGTPETLDIQAARIYRETGGEFGWITPQGATP